MTAPTSPEPLRPRLRSALTAAMKARDTAAVKVLRSALSAIDNAEAVDPAQAPEPESTVIAGAAMGLHAGEVARLDLTEARIVEVVRHEVREREEAAAHYEELGRTDDAARLRAEVRVLAAHLDGASDAGL